METLIQSLRYGGIILGSYLVGRGTITAEQVQAAIDQVVNTADKVYTAFGAIMASAAVVHGLYTKWNTKSVPAATAARIDVPTVSPVTGEVQR